MLSHFNNIVTIACRIATPDKHNRKIPGTVTINRFPAVPLSRKRERGYFLAADYLFSYRG